MGEEKYIKASIAERLLLDELLKIRNDFQIIYTTPVDKYDSWDAIIISGGTTYIIEIKQRTYSIQSFYSWIIEYEKYSALMKEHYSSGLIPLYINFHSNGVQIFDLINSKEPNWIETLLPSNSQDNAAQSKLKMNGLLNSSDANKIFADINLEEILVKANEKYQKDFGK